MKGTITIMPESNSALVAMSGGVDSSVAAALAQRDGLDCAGATMVLYPGADKVAEEARRAAEKLGLAFYVFDLTQHFAEQVIKPFINDYGEGRTPNPCVVCNKHLKFGAFLEKTIEMGRDHVVTGHYVQIERDSNGRYLLKKGADTTKDQSYVLYTLTQKQLAHIRFPLGGLTKSQVREIALEIMPDKAQGTESQDICFIPDGDYAKFIVGYTGKKPQKGRFIDTNGNDFGENNGIISYTVGQRRGLGLSMPHPPYVLELHPADNTVVIGKNEQLFSKSLQADCINFIPFEKLDSPFRGQVKIRYADPGHSATVHQTDEDRLLIEFDEPQRAITKGQSAVIYDGDYVIGGGTIV